MVYSNLQGIYEIESHLKDKNIMKKDDDSIKPIKIDNNAPSKKQINKIYKKYTTDKKF